MVSCLKHRWTSSCLEIRISRRDGSSEANFGTSRASVVTDLIHGEGLLGFFNERKLCFVSFQTQLDSGLGFILIHHGHRVALSGFL